MGIESEVIVQRGSKVADVMGGRPSGIVFLRNSLSCIF